MSKRSLYLPSFAQEEQDDESLVIEKRKKGSLNLEVIREVVLVALGVLLVLWLLLDDKWGSSPSGRSTGVKTTTSPLIVPSIPGLEDTPRKAPGDNNQDLQIAPAQDTTASYLFGGSISPKAVVVTVLDDTKHPREYLRKIIENRVEYARAHDYGVFIRFVRDFKALTHGHSKESTLYSRAAISRESMSAFPNTDLFWFLDESAIIMNPLVDIVEEFGDASHLGAKMVRGARIVRELPHVSSFKLNPPESVELILVRDTIGVSPVSLMYRNGVVAQSFFDFWLDPVFRYNPSMNTDAEPLRHLVQWHPYYLNKLAIVNTKLISAYAMPPTGQLHDELAYTDGDFVAYFDCDYSTETCRKEFQRFWAGRGRVAGQK